MPDMGSSGKGGTPRPHIPRGGRAAWRGWRLSGVSLPGREHSLESVEGRELGAQSAGCGWRVSEVAPFGHHSSMLCTPRPIRSGCGSTAQSTHYTGSSTHTTSSSSLPLPRWAMWGLVGGQGWGKGPVGSDGSLRPSVLGVVGRGVAGLGQWTPGLISHSAPLHPHPWPRTGASNGVPSPSTCRC